MKKIILIMIISSFIATSCDKEETSDVSKVTNYPVVSVIGEKTIVLTQGDAYTDAGGKAVAGSQVLPVESEGTVDTSIPDVYKITYSSINEDGFPASAERTVIVLKNTPSTINLEGTFVRNGANVNAITRLGDRVYKCSNAGGLPGPYTPDDNRISLVFYNIDDTSVYAPFQSNASPTGLGAETSVGTIVSPNEFNWTLFATGVYGQALRVFKRQ
jgi:hypothetical protein